jgi:microcystin-dependent protein
MDFFIGQIFPFPYTFVPQYFAPCDGRLIPIRDNAALFSLLGTTYGGDGQNTFAIPDLRPRNPDGSLMADVRVGQLIHGTSYIPSYIALQGIYPSRP